MAKKRSDNKPRGMTFLEFMHANDDNIITWVFIFLIFFGAAGGSFILKFCGKE